MTVKMKKEASVSWLFVAAGFSFGSIFDDVQAQETAKYVLKDH